VNNSYTDGDDVVSYLEFGAIATSPAVKKLYDFRTMQQAYDWFMHARYSQDMTCYIWMQEALQNEKYDEAGRLYQEMIYHKDDFSSHLSKWAALQVSGDRPPTFYEHGQTLFGCIEGIEVCELLLRKAGVPLPSPELVVADVTWEGFDISPFFNLMAARLHGNYRVRTHSDMLDIPASFSTSFAKGVTLLYALRCPEDFFKLFGRASCGIFDTSFSIGEERSTFIGTGKRICFLSIDQFLSFYKGSPSIILVRQDVSGIRDDGSRLYVEGIVCKSSEMASRFTRADADFRKGLQAAFPSLSKQLHLRSDPPYLIWTELSDFVGKLYA
jgi:hypothetical protein